MHERNYSTRDLELAPAWFALMIWMHHPYGGSWKLFVDRKSLKYVFTQKDLVKAAARAWAYSGLRPNAF